MNDRETLRPGVLIGLFLTGVSASAALGALTNAVNGRVSPDYFRDVMGWTDFADVPRAAIAQGIVEGLLFGSAFSLLFATGAGTITRLSCRYAFAARYLWLALGGALCGWILGGLIGVGLAAFAPEFFGDRFGLGMGSAESFRGLGWVGGSIRGVELGGLSSVVLSLVALSGEWRARSSSRA